MFDFNKETGSTRTNSFLPLQAISKVIMFKRPGYKQRTLRVEARVGNREVESGYGAHQIYINEKCGITTSNAHDAIEIFTCIPPLDGRYLSLQSFANVEMNIGEINVFTSGMNIFDAFTDVREDSCLPYLRPT